MHTLSFYIMPKLLLSYLGRENYSFKQGIDSRTVSIRYYHTEKYVPRYATLKHPHGSLVANNLIRIWYDVQNLVWNIVDKFDWHICALWAVRTLQSCVSGNVLFCVIVSTRFPCYALLGWQEPTEFQSTCYLFYLSECINALYLGYWRNAPTAGLEKSILPDQRDFFGLISAELLIHGRNIQFEPFRG